MKYSDGQEVRLGDQIRLKGDEGVVVFSVDGRQYSKDFPEEHWSYLKRGVMLKVSKYGLIHLEQDDPDLELVARSAT